MIVIIWFFSLLNISIYELLIKLINSSKDKWRRRKSPNIIKNVLRFGAKFKSLFQWHHSKILSPLIQLIYRIKQRWGLVHNNTWSIRIDSILQPICNHGVNLLTNGTNIKLWLSKYPVDPQVPDVIINEDICMKHIKVRLHVIKRGFVKASNQDDG